MADLSNGWSNATRSPAFRYATNTLYTHTVMDFDVYARISVAWSLAHPVSEQAMIFCSCPYVCIHVGSHTGIGPNVMTLAIASQKGSVGKTTLAPGLAVTGERAGHRTALFDIGPQGSAAFWKDT